MRFLIFIFFGALSSPLAANTEFLIKKPLKILHLTFHKGCAKEFEAVAHLFGHEVETWFIPDLPAKWLDGVSQGNVLYNIGHDRAERIWDLHQEAFLQFDVIITSDTAPLSRIFLQNKFAKPLIIWICCRFDYKDTESLDCNFPDEEFYRLFNEAHLKENVSIIAYTAFEHFYAQKKGVETGDLIITPCSPQASPSSFLSSIPLNIRKEDTFFLPPYSNETLFMNLSKHCSDLGISNYCGRYNGPADLKDFKGIIHLPYAWSNLAFFENIAHGVPYFVPSPDFLKKLMKQKNYWHTEPSYLQEENRFDLSEWYQPGREKIITYFDSWEDLAYKIKIADYSSIRKKTKEYAEDYQKTMLEKWSQIFNKVYDK